MLCLDSFTSGNWRFMMVLSSISSVFVYFASTFYLFESPRFLLASGQYDQSFSIINAIIKINYGDVSEDLSDEEKANLKEWSV